MPRPAERARALGLESQHDLLLLAPALIAAAVLIAAAFAGDAFATHGAAVVAAAVLGVAALLGRLPLAAGGAGLLGALVALSAWSGLSAAWSIAPDLSWAELNRGFVYTAFALLGIVLGSSGRRACRLVAAVLTLALGLTVAWALAGKAIPALFPDGGRAARLRDPVGYWNVLALLADALLVLGLWLAAVAAARPPLRALGAVLACASTVAVLLATSRTGVAAGVVAVLAWVWLGRARTERMLLALAAVVPGIGVAGWAFTRPGLVDDGQTYAVRVADGRWFALVFVLGATVAALAAVAVSRLELRGRTRSHVSRAVALLVAVAIVATAVGVAVGGDPLASGRAVPQGPARLAEAGLNNRRQFWAEALRVAEAKPLTGTGAGTFEIARRAVRDDATSAVEPHSVPLQFLAGTGPVGLLLFLGLMAVVAAAAVGAVRRLGGGEREAAAALAVVTLVYGVHALVDYDWNFPAATAPALVAAGALATAGRPPLEARPLAAGALAAFAAAALVSLTLPWLAERALRDVNRQLEAGDFAAAIDSAERARTFDPLSIEPLHKLAGVHARRRHVRLAREAYAAAVRLQPENPETWYSLGAYEFERGIYCQAWVHLNEAYTLDPKSTRWVPGGPLDEALERVNERGC